LVSFEGVAGVVCTGEGVSSAEAAGNAKPTT
jgi:hypothetical protein